MVADNTDTPDEAHEFIRKRIREADLTFDAIAKYLGMSLSMVIQASKGTSKSPKIQVFLANIVKSDLEQLWPQFYVSNIIVSSGPAKPKSLKFTEAQKWEFAGFPPFIFSGKLDEKIRRIVDHHKSPSGHLNKARKWPETTPYPYLVAWKPFGECFQIFDNGLGYPLPEGGYSQSHEHSLIEFIRQDYEISLIDPRPARFLSKIPTVVMSDGREFPLDDVIPDAETLACSMSSPLSESLLKLKSLGAYIYDPNEILQIIQKEKALKKPLVAEMPDGTKVSLRSLDGVNFPLPDGTTTTDSLKSEVAFLEADATIYRLKGKVLEKDPLQLVTVLPDGKRRTFHAYNKGYRLPDGEYTTSLSIAVDHYRRIGSQFRLSSPRGS